MAEIVNLFSTYIQQQRPRLMLSDKTNKKDNLNLSFDLGIAKHPNPFMIFIINYRSGFHKIL